MTYRNAEATNLSGKVFAKDKHGGGGDCPILSRKAKKDGRHCPIGTVRLEGKRRDHKKSPTGGGLSGYMYLTKVTYPEDASDDRRERYGVRSVVAWHPDKLLNTRQYTKRSQNGLLEEIRNRREKGKVSGGEELPQI